MDKITELDRLLALPEEPEVETGEPNVVWFKKSFNGPADEKYTYAAVKAGRLWFLTGTQAMPGKTWADLLAWIGEDAEIWWATDYEKLV